MAAGISFADLLGQLEAEHNRQETMIETLSKENISLKTKLSCMTGYDTMNSSVVHHPGHDMHVGDIPSDIPMEPKTSKVRDGVDAPKVRDKKMPAPILAAITDIDTFTQSYPLHTSSPCGQSGITHASVRSDSDYAIIGDGSCVANNQESEENYESRDARVSFEARGTLRSDPPRTESSCLSFARRDSIPPLQPLFNTEADDRPNKNNISKRISKFRQITRVNFELTTGEMVVQTRGGSWISMLQPLVVRPNAKKRILWDLSSVMMVSYDVIVIPLALIDVGDSPFMNAMDYVTTIYWSLDLPFCFLTGFHRQGTIEMRPNAVIWNYLTSWFFFDFAVVCVDWFIIISSLMAEEESAADDGDTTGFLRFGKAGGRVNRIFRAIRLMRFFKLQRLLVEILQLVKSEYVHTLCNVGLSVLFIAVIAHYIACGWYWTAKLNQDQDIDNWIMMSDLGDNSTLYKYATALHWSLTQFTPASMEVRPYNISERFYSIVVLFFALITFSSFLGSITTAMSQLRRLHNDQTNQQILLRKFFSDNKLSSELGQRIWKYIKNTHFVHKTRMPLDDLPLLKSLPNTLQRDLFEELYRPYLTRLPFFFHYASLGPEAGQTGLADICAEAIQELTSIAGDELFFDSQPATQIFIAMSGKMTYTDGESFEPTVVRPGLWVGEPALWLEWIHLGQLAASTSCEILKLSLERFRHVMRTQVATLQFAREYAKAFLHYMKHLEGNCAWRTDLVSNRDDLHELCFEAFRKIGYDDKRLAVITASRMHRMNSLSAGTAGVFHRLRDRLSPFKVKRHSSIST